MRRRLLTELKRFIGYDVYCYLGLLKDELPDLSKDDSDGLECRALSLRELGAYCDDPRYELNPAFLEDCEQSGHVCYGAFASGELASYTFFARRPTLLITGEPGSRFHFPRDWIYIFKSLTLAPWRGRRLHARVMVHGMRELRRDPGVAGFVALILARNDPSLTSVRRLGFRTFRVTAMRFTARPYVLSWPLGASAAMRGDFLLASQLRPEAGQITTTTSS
jgi:hypothetical protein